MTTEKDQNCSRHPIAPAGRCPWCQAEESERRQHDEKDATRRCRWCPPGCKSCEPRDCECYAHQDWPDTAFDDAGAARLARCIDAPGCDGRAHALACNNALYGGSR